MKAHTLIAIAIASLFATAVSADEVKLNGATTVVDRVINPYKAAVEKSSGHTLAIIGTGTGRGLADLIEGKCDAAMSSEPLEIAVEAAKTLGQEIDAKKLQFSVTKNDEIVFVTHKSNPVKALKWEQIRDIHTGKIKNWKEVGGKDMPIVVFLDAPSGGTRAMIKKIVMEGGDYSADGKTQPSVKKAGEMVGVTEAGIAGIGKGFVEADKVNIVQSKKLERPLGFITMGAPSAKVEKVILAFKAEAAK